MKGDCAKCAGSLSGLLRDEIRELDKFSRDDFSHRGGVASKLRYLHCCGTSFVRCELCEVQCLEEQHFATYKNSLLCRFFGAYVPGLERCYEVSLPKAHGDVGIIFALRSCFWDVGGFVWW